jgi:hypothetical protein
MRSWRFFLSGVLVLIAVITCSENAISVIPPKIDYKITISLDVKEKILYGEEEITYTSGADAPLNNLYLHLYPNAYRDRESTAGREAEKKLHNYILAYSKKKDLGYIRIDSLKTNGSLSRFKIDDTIMEIDLSNPLQPGEAVVIKMNFLVKIPKMITRFGYIGKHFTIAQWYPKMVVYDEKGWHPDQYHLIGEFYGDFATFNVSITLPQTYYVGSTGYLVESMNGDNNVPLISKDKNAGDSEKTKKDKDARNTKASPTKTLVFHAEEVHDFAWVTSPDYVKDEAVWSGTTVRVLVFKEDAKKWKNLLNYSVDAVKYFSEQISAYPYNNLTVVEAYLGLPAGMEYPTLSMIDPMINSFFARLSRTLEFTTIHEICHNWWYGIAANDELNDAWLDEGFTEYFTTRYAEWKYEKGNVYDFPNWVPFKMELPYSRLEELSYLQYSRSGKDKIVAKPAYMLDDYGMYDAIIYNKGSKILDMLNYVMGDSLFSEFIRFYFSEYKFKHPSIQNVKEVAEQVSGQKLDWFFEQWLYTTKKCDYAVGSISKEKTNEGGFITNVEIKREGEIIMPVEVEATFKNGEKETERVFADDKSEILTFHTKSPIEKIKIDPEHRLLEVNRLNNESGFLPPIKLQFGLIPSQEVDSYFMLLKPTIWYNDVDKLKFGINISGSYLLEDNAFSLGTSYGTKTQILNYDFAYSTPLRIMRKCRVGLNFSKDNGMRNLAVGVRLGNKSLPSTLRDPGASSGYPGFNSALEFSYSNKHDNRYFDEKWFSLGKTSIVSLNSSFINKGYHGFTKLNLDISRGLGILNADYAFNRAFASASQEFRLIKTGELIAYARASAGYEDGNPPNQEKLDIALGVPESSVDPVGSLVNTGGGGVRGYQDRTILGKELFALNFELRSEILNGLSISPSLFFDLGRIKDNINPEFDNEFIYDAGVEFRLLDMVYLSFPFWLSQPEAREKKFCFRASVTLSLTLQ